MVKLAAKGLKRTYCNDIVTSLLASQMRKVASEAMVHAYINCWCIDRNQRCVGVAVFVDISDAGCDGHGGQSVTMAVAVTLAVPWCLHGRN